MSGRAAASLLLAAALLAGCGSSGGSTPVATTTPGVAAGGTSAATGATAPPATFTRTFAAALDTACKTHDQELAEASASAGAPTDDAGVAKAFTTLAGVYADFAGHLTALHPPTGLAPAFTSYVAAIRATERLDRTGATALAKGRDITTIQASLTTQQARRRAAILILNVPSCD